MGNSRPLRAGRIDYNLSQILYFLGPLTSEECMRHLNSATAKCQLSRNQIPLYLKYRANAERIETSGRGPPVYKSRLLEPLGDPFKSKRKVDLYIQGFISKGSET